MEESILISVKKAIGLTEEYDVFDSDIIMYINSLFSNLWQLGVGPTEKPFYIESKDEEWGDFIPVDDTRYSAVRAYICVKAQLVFDPPTSSIILQCKQDFVKEQEWRLNITAETP